MELLRKLFANFMGYPIEWFEESSYYNADGVLGKDMKLYFPEMGNFLVAFRMRDIYRKKVGWN